MAGLTGSLFQPVPNFTQVTGFSSSLRVWLSPDPSLTHLLGGKCQGQGQMTHFIFKTRISLKFQVSKTLSPVLYPSDGGDRLLTWGSHALGRATRVLTVLLLRPRWRIFHFASFFPVPLPGADQSEPAPPTSTRRCLRHTSLMSIFPAGNRGPEGKNVP